MAFDVGRCCGGERALFATERFFSGMNQHVALEMRSLFGRVIALCASKRLLTAMNQHMSFQFAGPIACEVALIAIIGLLSIIKRLLGIFCKISFHFNVFFPAKDFLNAPMQG